MYKNISSNSDGKQLDDVDDDEKKQNKTNKQKNKIKI